MIFTGMGTHPGKKKIIHLIFSFTIGGAENLIVDLVNNQSSTYNVYLFIINNHLDEDLLKTINSEVKIILINRKPGSKNLFKIFKLNYLVGLIGPDIIHCHNEMVINVLFLYRKKTVVTVHDVNMNVELFYRYSKVVAISKAVKDDVELRSKNKLKAEIVYNGVDFSKVEAKTLWNLGNQINLVQVSRLSHEKKGQDILLEAIFYLKTKKGYNNINLQLVGSGDSLEVIKSLIKKYSLTECVSIVENKNRKWIYKHLKDFDILIQPSRFEGFGLTVIEGMAAKVPVIASELDGPKEILSDGKYGELFKSPDSVQLAGKIEDVIQLYNKQAIKEKTNNAYEYALSHFSLEAMLIGYEKIYNNLN